MTWQERIVVHPQILVRKPVIRGTRLAVELIVDLLAQGSSEEEILKNHPGLTCDDLSKVRERGHAVRKDLSPYPPVNVAARLLANESVPGAVIAALRQQGPDVA